jgi:GntR family transcriptional regulator
VLGVAVGAPLLQVRRVAVDLGGRHVEYRVSTVLTTQHDYVSLLARPG